MLTRIIISTVLLFFLSSCGEVNKSTEMAEKSSPSEEPAKSIEVKEEKVEEITETNLLGKRMFILCSACHNLKMGEEHKVGPNLHGIFGSKAAAKEGFAYSDALKASGITWDETNMRAWIENPAEFVEGTNMAFIGLKDKDQQTALIDYLKEQTQ